MLTNKSFWRRIAAVASLVWIGGVVIASATNREFGWSSRTYVDWGRYGDWPGPAALTAIVGVAVIWTLCLGVPWIASARSSEPPGSA